MKWHAVAISACESPIPPPSPGRAPGRARRSGPMAHGQGQAGLQCGGASALARPHGTAPNEGSSHGTRLALAVSAPLLAGSDSHSQTPAYL